MQLANGLLLGLLSIGFSCCCCLACQSIEQRFQFGNSNIYLRLRRGQQLQYELMQGSRTLQTVRLDNFVTTQNLKPTPTGSLKLSDGTTSIEFTLLKAGADLTHLRVSRDQVLRNTQPRDCFALQTAHTHWYAGPEHHYQYWPVERQQYSNFSYLPKEAANVGLAERYWLSSSGVFIYVEPSTPLFIDQQAPGFADELCLSAHSALPYDTRVESAQFSYHLAIAKNARLAHMHAVRTLLGKPKGHPDERMVMHPIWSTWALYKTHITADIVRDFAKQITQHGFNNSQLEIDDDWEDCYGALTFRKAKFPNIKQLTDELKAQGFRVTLWIHPFINKDCTSSYNEALSQGLLVLDHAGQPDTQWWNSQPNQAAYIDFTKRAAQDWFSKRLQRLQTEDGIDSFKFDAGETSWVPADPVLQGNAQLTPLQITSDYVRTVGAFGDMVEVRSGQGTQDLPIFVRMIDKDSEWGWNNGLVTLITTLLQMNLNGYPFVLPDMIGGNGYNERPPDKQLFIRWLQANVFMPSLQFSYVPWNFDNETIELSKQLTQLHAQYTPYIMRLFQRAVDTGEPVNAPLWWVAPDDAVAQGIYDEFLLGEDIIAAPIVSEHANKRDIYLPAGQWLDGNDQQLYTGPVWLMEYVAPLSTLPYFVRVGFEL